MGAGLTPFRFLLFLVRQLLVAVRATVGTAVTTVLHSRENPALWKLQGDSLAKIPKHIITTPNNDAKVLSDVSLWRSSYANLVDIAQNYQDHQLNIIQLEL